jgi:hypothetical protein
MADMASRFRGQRELLSEVGLRVLQFSQNAQAFYDDATPDVGLRLNFMLLGSPGIGKSSMAAKVGELYVRAGLLLGDGRHAEGARARYVLEGTRADVVAEFEGQTAVKATQWLQSGLERVIFLDEAYQIRSNRQDGYGAEALAELIKFMDNTPGRAVVFAAGYAREMQQQFYGAGGNRGLERRFGLRVPLAPLTGQRLFEIFNEAVNNGFALCAEWHKSVRAACAADPAKLQAVVDAYGSGNVLMAKDPALAGLEALFKLSVEARAMPSGSAADPPCAQLSDAMLFFVRRKQQRRSLLRNSGLGAPTDPWRAAGVFVQDNAPSVLGFATHLVQTQKLALSVNNRSAVLLAPLKNLPKPAADATVDSIETKNYSVPAGQATALDLFAWLMGWLDATLSTSELVAADDAFRAEQDAIAISARGGMTRPGAAGTPKDMAKAAVVLVLYGRMTDEEKTAVDDAVSGSGLMNATVFEEAKAAATGNPALLRAEVCSATAGAEQVVGGISEDAARRSLGVPGGFGSRLTLPSRRINGGA